MDFQGDFLRSLQGGYNFGAQIKEGQDRSALARLASQSYGAPEEQRPSLLAQIAGISPHAAQQQKQSFQNDDEVRNKAMVQMAKLLTSAPEQSRPGLWQTFVPELSRFGLVDLPKEYTPETAPIINQAAQSLVNAYGGGQQQRNLAISPGSAIVDPDSGQVIYERPFAPTRENWQVENVPDGRGGFLQMERNPATGEWRKPSYGASPAQGAPAGPQPGAPQGGQINPSQDFAVLSQEFGIQPSSVLRTPERNAAVGGVPNSYHLTGEAGDFPVPPQMKAQFVARAQAMGYQAIDEGDHVHLEPPRRGATSQPGGAGMGFTPPKADGEQFRTLTPQEVAELGLPQGTIAQRSPTGQVQIINKPRDLPTGGQVIDNGDGTTTYIPAGKISEGERNAAGFYQRMEAANREMDRLMEAGYDPTNRRDFYTAGGDVLNPLATAEGQQYRQAQENWVRANLRKESGAAIGVAEMDQERKNYFPIPGDSPEVIAQKARNREVTERAMRQAAGGGLAPPGASSAAQRPANQSGSVPPQAVEFLRKNPSLRQQFEQKYGVSADDYLR